MQEISGELVSQWGHILMWADQRRKRRLLIVSCLHFETKTRSVQEWTSWQTHALKLLRMKAATDRRETDMFPVCKAFTLLPLWHEKHHPSALRVSQDPSGWQLLCAPQGRPRIIHFRSLCLHFCTWILVKIFKYWTYSMASLEEKPYFVLWAFPQVPGDVKLEMLMFICGSD